MKAVAVAGLLAALAFVLLPVGGSAWGTSYTCGPAVFVGFGDGLGDSHGYADEPDMAEQRQALNDACQTRAAGRLLAGGMLGAASGLMLVIALLSNNYPIPSVVSPTRTERTP